MRVETSSQGAKSLCSFFAICMFEYITRFTIVATITSRVLKDVMKHALDQANYHCTSSLDDSSLDSALELVQVKNILGHSGIMPKDTDVESVFDVSEVTQRLRTRTGFHFIVVCGMTVSVYHRSTRSTTGLPQVYHHYHIFNSHAPTCYAQSFASAEEVTDHVLRMVNYHEVVRLDANHAQIDMLHASASNLPELRLSCGP